MKNYLLLLMLLVILSVSCKDAKRALQPGITGGTNELLFVMNKTLWQSSVGDSIKAVFKQDLVGLPQEEPIFDLVCIPLSFFDKHLKSHRNIIQVDISKRVRKPNVFIKKNAWAKGQYYIKIVAKDDKQFNKLLSENKDRLLSLFVKAELDRLSKYYKKFPDASIYNKLKKKYGYMIGVPSGYNINKDTLGFVWMSTETPKNSKGLMLYSYEYKDKSQFTSKLIVEKRNAMLKSYIPGPLKGSYMITEDKRPVSLRQYKVNGHYAIELRGLWKVKNDFMGGPFVSLSILDEKANRIVCIDGYVYAPNEKKRNYVRQVEAILHTLTFKSVEEDKK